MDSIAEDRDKAYFPAKVIRVFLLRIDEITVYTALTKLFANRNLYRPITQIL